MLRFATAGMILALTGMVAGETAWAQPIADEPYVDMTPPPAAEVPPAPPPQEPVVAPAPQSDTSASTVRAEPEESSDNRPVGMSPGIGVGYTMPADILNPNTASVRFRFPSGLTFEPIVELSTGSDSQEFMGAETESKENDMTVATQVRLPLAMRGKVDLVLLGSVGFSRHATIPDGADNDTTTTSFALAWGLGLDYWPKQSWAISASATNPLISLSKTSQEMGTETLENTSTDFGAVFRPGFRLMLHMFF